MAPIPPPSRGEITQSKSLDRDSPHVADRGALFTEGAPYLGMVCPFLKDQIGHKISLYLTIKKIGVREYVIAVC